MTEVLKALQELRVGWKKIGQYNMKCRWVPGHHDGMINNAVHNNNYFGDDSSIIETDGVMKSPNVVKFEVQVMFLPYHCFCCCKFCNSSYGWFQHSWCAWKLNLDKGKHCSANLLE